MTGPLEKDHPETQRARDSERVSFQGKRATWRRRSGRERVKESNKERKREMREKCTVHQSKLSEMHAHRERERRGEWAKLDTAK